MDSHRRWHRAARGWERTGPSIRSCQGRELLTPSRSNKSLVSLLLSQRLVETTAPALKASEYLDFLDSADDPARLPELDADEIAEATGVDGAFAARVVQLLE